MRLARSSLVLGITIVVSWAAGCADSTGPVSIAHHLDALYRQACSLAYDPAHAPFNGSNYNPNSPYYQRCLLLSVLLAGPASGAEPSPVRVMTSTGVSTWHGLVIDEFDTASTGARVDSNFVLIVYSDPNVTTALVSELDGGGGAIDQSAYIVANDTITVDAYQTALTVSTQTLGRRCVDTRGLDNPLGDTLSGFPPIEYDAAICQLATFAASERIAFPDSVDLDPSLRSITIDRQTLNGISVMTFSPYLNRVGHLLGRMPRRRQRSWPRKA
jgi:hypothetical protein